MKRFRRWVTAFVLGFFMIGLCSGTALADQGKDQFVSNVAAFQNAALKVNPDLSDLVSGQLHFEMDMKDLPANDVTIPQSVTADVLYKVDADQSQAWIQIKGNLAMSTGKQPFEAEVFFNDGMLIIPAASLRTMNPLLFGNIPCQYLYMDLSDEMPDEAEFYQAFMEASSQREQMVAAYQDLLATLVKPLPERCFTVAGSGSSTLRMGYADFMVFAQAFEDPAYQQEIAGKFAAIFPANAGITQEDMMEGLNSPEDPAASDGPDTVQVRQFEISASPNSFATLCDISASDEEMRMDLFIDSKGDVAANRLAQTTKFQLKIDDRTDENTDVTIDAAFQESDTEDAITFAADMAMQITESGQTGKMDFALSGTARADSDASIAMPVLTEANSMDMDALTSKESPPKDSAIMLENGGNWSVLLGVYLEQGHLMASVFDLSHSLDLIQTQTESTRVTLSDGSKQVTITVGSSTYQVGGNTKPLAVPAVYRDYEIFVPVRTILEEFGYHVNFDEAAEVLHVSK